MQLTPPQIRELERLEEISEQVHSMRALLREKEEAYTAQWKKAHTLMPSLFRAIADDDG